MQNKKKGRETTMQYRKGSELRELFLSFFESKGSRRMASFPLIPDDPTLLFTIAGMVPFKPYYLGLRTPEVTRVATSQKCVRTNDIDNVGRTARHHTFFEMLGNFSWGDYFKAEAIPWAWEFLTDKVGLDPDRLYVTIYKDDEEAFDIWTRVVGFPPERIIRFDEDENFWYMGPAGPCGPCSEILYDQGVEFSCGKPDCAPGCDCDRYLEIWNLVFTQYDRQEDGSLQPLPRNNIDTGMGLERLASVVQGARTDFETDLFMPLIDKACAMSGHVYGSSAGGDMAVRVISDHLRSVAFMIADGILPSNEGRGYVLRRLLRRAVRYGRLLGLEDPFLLQILPTLYELMGDPYRELLDNRATIEQVIDMEEKKFGRTLDQGTLLLEKEIAVFSGEAGKVLSGDVAFELYDTYGFPLELTKEMCEEKGLTVDEEAFLSRMEAQRDRARASSKVANAVIAGDIYNDLFNRLGATPFTGYSAASAESRVLAVVRDGKEVDEADAGQEADVVLSVTPFYAERGGQLGDRGIFESPALRAEVTDTVYGSGDLIVHRITVKEGTLQKDSVLTASVDEARRWAIRRHHTATHLLHEALCRVLGDHVRQAGSLVRPDQLRFDFTHFDALTPEQIDEVERIVNERIVENIPLRVTLTDLESARSLGAKALFDEKYGDEVRVIQVPGFSTELCGGVHVDATGDIGLFKIIREEGIGSGVRRVTAVTGLVSLELFQKEARTSARLAGMFQSGFEEVPLKVEELHEEIRRLRKENQDVSLKATLADLDRFLTSKVTVGPVSLIVAFFDDLEMDLLRQVGDAMKNRAEENSALFLLASRIGDDIRLVAMASDNAVKAGAHAGKFIKQVAGLLGGGGGGKPNMAQAGVKTSAEKGSNIKEVLTKAPGILRDQLGL